MKNKLGGSILTVQADLAIITGSNGLLNLGVVFINPIQMLMYMSIICSLGSFQRGVGCTDIIRVTVGMPIEMAFFKNLHVLTKLEHVIIIGQRAPMGVGAARGVGTLV